MFRQRDMLSRTPVPWFVHSFDTTAFPGARVKLSEYPFIVAL
jgi:hypothetical protein